MTREIVVSSSDEALGERVVGALRSLGVPISRTATAGATTALHVVHRAGDAVPIAQELAGATGPVIALLDSFNLGAVVEIMNASEHVIGVLDARTFDDAALTSVAARALGTARTASASAAARSWTVSAYDEKVACLAAVRAQAEADGVRPTALDSLEQCLDEMIMNGLYDAAVDGSGRPLFAGVSPRGRMDFRTSRSAEVRYVHDAGRVSVAVRDTFGTLTREIVLKHLRKGLYAQDKVETKVGGAGLGLFLMASSASHVAFTVAPGGSTEVCCTFGAGARSQIDFVAIRRDEPPRAAARRLRTPAARKKLAGHVASAVGLVVLALLPLVPAMERPTASVTIVSEPADATVELDGRRIRRDSAGAVVATGLTLGRRVHVRVHRDGYAPAEDTFVPDASAAPKRIVLQQVATVEVASEPAGAAVTIDGVAAGATPLVLTTLAPGKAVTLAFEKPGYIAATAQLTVPAAGARSRHLQPLGADESIIRVRLETVPPGARVTRDGAPPTPDRTYTPAEILVARGKPERLRIEMPGYAPVTREVAPEPGARVETVQLVPAAP